MMEARTEAVSYVINWQRHMSRSKLFTSQMEDFLQRAIMDWIERLANMYCL